MPGLCAREAERGHGQGSGHRGKEEKCANGAASICVMARMGTGSGLQLGGSVPVPACGGANKPQMASTAELHLIHQEGLHFQYSHFSSFALIGEGTAIAG